VENFTAFWALKVIHTVAPGGFLQWHWPLWVRIDDNLGTMASIQPIKQIQVSKSLSNLQGKQRVYKISSFFRKKKFIISSVFFFWLPLVWFRCFQSVKSTSSMKVVTRRILETANLILGKGIQMYWRKEYHNEIETILIT
jgi:hypothetical protein